MEVFKWVWLLTCRHFEWQLTNKNMVKAAVLLGVPIQCPLIFKKCICIIDCFEDFCERPSDLIGLGTNS